MTPCVEILHDPIRYCGEPCTPVGEPVLLGGTAIVSLQRYRCERSPSHWWDSSQVLVAEIVPA